MLIMIHLIKIMIHLMIIMIHLININNTDNNTLNESTPTSPSHEIVVNENKNKIKNKNIGGHQYHQYHDGSNSLEKNFERIYYGIKINGNRSCASNAPSIPPPTSYVILNDASPYDDGTPYEVDAPYNATPYDDHDATPYGDDDATPYGGDDATSYDDTTPYGDDGSLQADIPIENRNIGA